MACWHSDRVAGTGQCSCLGHAPEGLCCFQGECAHWRVCTLSHMWPLKTSKITRGTWSGVDDFLETSSVYGRITFSMNRSVVSSLAQWFGICHMLKPLGNVWFCWGGGCAMLCPLVHALVLTHKHIEGVHWFIETNFSQRASVRRRTCQNHWEMSEKDGISQLVQICSGSSFPEIVPASVAVTWHLSLRPAISTFFAPSCSRSSLMRALAWHLLDPNSSQAYRILCASLNL